MSREQLDRKIGDFEEILQNIAGSMASGVLSEKLSPSELLEKTERYVQGLVNLTISSEEPMLLLRPEKTHTVKVKCKNLIQTLTTFKDILIQNTPEPLANSRLAFEQLRKALTDSSDLLFLMREVRDHPSPLINAVLAFKKASETKGSVTSIRASEDLQPLLKYVLSRIDELGIAIAGLEKKVSEMKQTMKELQEESLKMLSAQTSEQPRQTENKIEKRQRSLSNFKAEKN